MAVGPTTDHLKEYRFKAVDSAIEWSKQIITLSTGTLVLTGTFIKDIFTGDSAHDTTIVWCWVFMSLAAILGIFFLGGISAMLNKASSSNEIDIFKLSSRILAFAHVFCFISGLICFIFYIHANFKNFTPKNLGVAAANIIGVSKNPTGSHPPQALAPTHQGSKPPPATPAQKP